jgi:hypothetical protein
LGLSESGRKSCHVDFQASDTPNVLLDTHDAIMMQGKIGSRFRGLTSHQYACDPDAQELQNMTHDPTAASLYVGVLTVALERLNRSQIRNAANRRCNYDRQR